MPIELQRKKLVDMLNKMKARELIDDGVDVWAMTDHLDPEHHYDENIKDLYHHGIINELLLRPETEIDEAELKEQEREYLLKSITPHYRCAFASCDFTCYKRGDMIEHFKQSHEFDEAWVLPDPKHQYDIEYILLKYLVERYEKGKRKHYIRATNKELWQNLVRSLGLQLDDKDAPSNQTPRHLLNSLGLLTKIKGQKKKNLGYDSSGNRVYHINTRRLKEAIYNSEYNDLKFRCGVFEKIELLEIKPPINKLPSPTSKTEMTDGFDDDF